VKFIICLSAVCLVGVAGAGAQSTPAALAAAASAARVRIGPFALNPTLALTDAGVDDNVFNNSDAEHPRKDFTMTLSPATAFWLHLGRTWVTGTVTEDLVYYQTYADERSANTRYDVRLVRPFNRVKFELGSDYRNTRERPGFEIDARPRHSEIGVDGSIEIRALGKTSFAANVRRRTVQFADDALFDGNRLQIQLNRTMTGLDGIVRHQLTPLTSLTFSVQRQQDRFAFSPARDSDSTAGVGGVKFEASALLTGTATFGYRRFSPLSPDVPEYRGSTAAVDLSFRARSSTRLGVKILRDLQYSFEEQQPYYIETGISASITQALYGPFDVVASAGIEELAYRGRLINFTSAVERVDTVHIYHGGIRYRVGKDTRVGFNLDKQERLTDAAHRPYSGLRYGTSVTYGF
jgi:hypothetical protein